MLQEESHFFRLIGQALPHIMYMEGGDWLYPDIESLGVDPAPATAQDDGQLSPFTEFMIHYLSPFTVFLLHDFK